MKSIRIFLMLNFGPPIKARQNYVGVNASNNTFFQFNSNLRYVFLASVT